MIEFNDYLDIVNCELIVRRYSNQNERWMAQIDNGEILVNPSVLSGDYGNGHNPNEAILDYLEKIKGKTIIINARSKEYRREFVVPENIKWV